MAGVLDPVGPERPRTYWVRRAAVIAAVVALIIIVVVAANAIAGAGGDGDREAAPPPGGPTLQPSAAPGSATPTPEESGPASSRTPSASTTPSPSPSSSPSRPAESSPERSRSAEPSPSPSTSTSRAPRECDDDDLRATLTGPRQIEVGTTVTFRAGVINGGTEACRFVLDPDDYEFRIYSGTDRIWSTDDCERWIPSVDTVLGPEKATEWTISWSVTRSQGCGATEDVLRPGTYAANSVLDDVDPAQLVMTLS